MKILTSEAIEFLTESNHIEEEWSAQALDDAILAWNYIKRIRKMTLPVILKTHALLMTTRPCEPSWKGQLRTGQVMVGGEEKMFWVKVPEALEEWCDAVNQAIEFSEDISKEHHIQYEDIHPFFDGNGRTGRIFYNWERKMLGLPIDVITYKDRDKYYQWFH